MNSHLNRNAPHPAIVILPCTNGLCVDGPAAAGLFFNILSFSVLLNPKEMERLARLFSVFVFSACMTSIKRRIGRGRPHCFVERE